MRKYFIGSILVMGALLLISPAPAQAAGLNEAQIQAVLGLLTAFNVDSPTLKTVEAALRKNTSTGITTPEVKPTTNATTTKPVTFTARMSSACKAIYYSALDIPHKDACLDWWLTQDPILPDGGTNMPSVWYKYYNSK
jgi:hypothetical protein